MVGVNKTTAALKRGDAEAVQRLAQEAQDLLAGVQHKPGGSGVSSGGATHTGSSPIQGGEVKPNLPVGEISSRPLTQSDLGINGVLSELKGTYSLNNGIAIVRVDMIRGEINNPLQIVGNLIDSAKSNGATTLRIEGTIANEQLLRVLQRRYGLNTQ